MGLDRLSQLHLGFTLAMVGLMTTVQLVVYPQYHHVEVENFSVYVVEHGQKIGRPLMLFAPAEVLLALALWLAAPSGRIKRLAFLAGALLATAWVVTMIWFAPLHGRLINESYDAARIDQLINTNWIRTMLWWMRGLAAFVLVGWVSQQSPHPENSTRVASG